VLGGAAELVFAVLLVVATVAGVALWRKPGVPSPVLVTAAAVLFVLAIGWSRADAANEIAVLVKLSSRRGVTVADLAALPAVAAAGGLLVRAARRWCGRRSSAHAGK
jgi:hypothetical protein